MMRGNMLNVAFYLLFSSVSLCWMSLFWVSWRQRVNISWLVKLCLQ